MRIPPPEVILSWPSPDYQHPVTRGDALLVVMIIFSVLMLAAATGRFYSRIYLNKWFGWDDSMMVLALIFAIGTNVSVILANRMYGWNRHVWDLEYDKIQNANIVAFTAKLLFVGAATFTRMSLICFYFRLVRQTGVTWFRWILHASMAFVVAIGIGFTCFGVWLCVPVQAYWRWPLMPKYKCLDEGITMLVIGILNCLADLLTTVLPIPIVMRLQMPLKQRIGVCFLLSLGVIVTAAGAVRTYYIWAAMISSWDETWLSYPLWICAAVEIDLAVICACGPALRPLLYKPISQLMSLITSKLSSLRSPPPSQDTTQTSSQGAKSSCERIKSVDLSATRSPLPKQARTGDFVSAGDEEHGVSQRNSNLDIQCVTGNFAPKVGSHETDDIPSHYSKASLADSRKPTLEIIKRQSVDQEVSYLPH